MTQACQGSIDRMPEAIKHSGKATCMFHGKKLSFLTPNPLLYQCCSERIAHRYIHIRYNVGILLSSVLEGSKCPWKKHNSPVARIYFCTRVDVRYVRWSIFEFAFLRFSGCRTLPYILVSKKNCSMVVSSILPRIKGPYPANNNLQKNFWYTPLLP